MFGKKEKKISIHGKIILAFGSLSRYTQRTETIDNIKFYYYENHNGSNHVISLVDGIDELIVYQYESGSDKKGTEEQWLHKGPWQEKIEAILDDLIDRKEKQKVAREEKAQQELDALKSKFTNLFQK